jgi:hypothetical protein
MPFDFCRAAIFPLQPGTKIPLESSRGYKDARAGYPIPLGCNIAWVPHSLGLVCIDLDPGHDVNWAAANLPATLTVKTPRGFHLYYKCEERFGNGRLGPHIDVRSANGYALLPPSRLADGTGYEWLNDVEPVALPEQLHAMLQVQRRIEHQPLAMDAGDDNESNLAKARTLLKNIDPCKNGYDIACCLRRDIGLSHNAAVEVFQEWSDTLDWPWDYEKIWSVCRNAGRYGHGDQGVYGGAGIGAYDPSTASVGDGFNPWSNGHDTSSSSGTMPDLDNTARGWLQRELKPAEQMIGPINTQSRVMLVAPTGIGKTHVGMAVAVAVAAGAGWLHWTCSQARRVLYLDGEMPRPLLKERLIDALGRVENNWEVMDNLVLVSTADYPDLPYLNIDNSWVNSLVALHQPALIIFDNIQALTNGDQKSGETWQSMLKWMRSLTDAGIAQLWIHHANEQGGMYGDKTRGWQLDTIIELTRVHEAGDLIFDLKYTKHRELHPRINRAAYASGRVSLENDRWKFISVELIRRRDLDIALAGESEQGISIGQLVKRLQDNGDSRTASAIKKDLQRFSQTSSAQLYIKPGINPIKWGHPGYNEGVMSQAVPVVENKAESP